MNINGTWEGEYIYGDDYPEILIGKAVKFTVYLSTNGSEVSGTFIDEESADVFPEGGVLVGVTENNYISMTKRYPHGWEVDEAGENVFKEDEPSHYIMYEGYFSDDRFEGKWEVPLYYEDKEYESIYDYEITGGSGTWWMKKKKE